MKRSLRWYDLVGFGVGGMVEAGVFVTIRRASCVYAGPSIIVSYAIAGLCALLSSFCYIEFVVDMPVAGGAFSYICVTFGEFLTLLSGANLIIDCVVECGGGEEFYGVFKYCIRLVLPLTVEIHHQWSTKRVQ